MATTHGKVLSVNVGRARESSLRRARASFEALTDIALAGRTDGLGLWGEFKSDASNDALRSNIRVFLAGALEATTSFASWALSHLSRAPDVQDRKSTRLNSSHQLISYAVFCLKK